MCGINGYFQFKRELDSEQTGAAVHLMNEKIIHRGPDEEGIFRNDEIGMGIRRLSIIDLQTGKQPMYNEDGSLAIIANGEIYNYKSLKSDLLSKGHIFTSMSDSEVILHCYEEYGEDCFNKLTGMFAFAIYNIIEQKLIIARDRAGEKPLYYYKDKTKFIFASELKSILVNETVPKIICKKALNQYLQLTYIPAPLTIIENISKLLAGHYMVIQRDGEIVIRQYWDAKYDEGSIITNYDECRKLLREAMFEAVEECMNSDVPLGAFLSGGIDSATIVGTMSKISSKPIETFTIGFKNKGFDESNRAELTSKLHNTKHHIFWLDYNNTLPELDKILNNIDEPFADSSYIPTYLVSKCARQYVKAVLTGDAGDELFGGYSKYLIRYYADKYKSMPKWFRENIIKRTVFSLPDKGETMRKIRKVIDNAEKDIFTQRKNLMCLGFKSNELPLLLSEYTNGVEALDFIKDYYDKGYSADNEINSALYTDFKVVLEGDMLPKVDRAGMLCSLEARVPMLHKNVVETAFIIPYKYKINSSNSKIILKDTFSDLIPKELLNARKSGFGVPVGDWLRNELKYELMLLTDRSFIEEQAIFNYNYIEQLIKEHYSFTKNRSSELWTLFVFQKWYKRYLLTK